MVCVSPGNERGTVRTPGIGLNLRSHDGIMTTVNGRVGGHTPGDEGLGVASGK